MVTTFRYFKYIEFRIIHATLISGNTITFSIQIYSTKTLIAAVIVNQLVATAFYIITSIGIFGIFGVMEIAHGIRLRLPVELVSRSY